MFEHEGDIYDFENMTVKTMRGFRKQIYTLHIVNDCIFYCPMDMDNLYRLNDSTMVKLMCPNKVQLAYNWYIADDILLEK